MIARNILYEGMKHSALIILIQVLMLSLIYVSYILLSTV